MITRTTTLNVTCDMCGLNGEAIIYEKGNHSNKDVLEFNSFRRIKVKTDLGHYYMDLCPECYKKYKRED